ncbi:hypothetical protein WDW37_01820 [Bdellovibrionota bacterium FG-1]
MIYLAIILSVTSLQTTSAYANSEQGDKYTISSGGGISHPEYFDAVTTHPAGIGLKQGWKFHFEDRFAFPNTAVLTAPQTDIRSESKSLGVSYAGDRFGMTGAFGFDRLGNYTELLGSSYRFGQDTTLGISMESDSFSSFSFAALWGSRSATRYALGIKSGTPFLLTLGISGLTGGISHDFSPLLEGSLDGAYSLDSGSFELAGGPAFHFQQFHIGPWLQMDKSGAFSIGGNASLILAKTIVIRGIYLQNIRQLGISLSICL